MSDQWVDKEGRLRNSSGRYRTGERAPASIEMEEDDKKFEQARKFHFVSPLKTAWSYSCMPNLGAILVNEDMDICVGLEISHIRALKQQLNEAIVQYEELRNMEPNSLNKMLLDNAGITVTPKREE